MASKKSVLCLHVISVQSYPEKQRDTDILEGSTSDFGSIYLEFT